MTTLSTGVSLENCEEQSFSPRRTDNNDILSSARIKQRRATVAPAEIPNIQLPRYLRDPNRYGNGSSRRQSLPATSLNNKLGSANYSQKIPEKLKQKLDQIDNDSDETTSVRDGGKSILGQKRKIFPLDNRLQDCDKNGINSSSERSSESYSNSKSDIPLIFEERLETPVNNDMKTFTHLFNSKHNGINNTTLSTGHGSYEHPRRHSVAVSVFTDSHRSGFDRPLTGRSDFGKYDDSVSRTKDKVITVEPRERRASINPVRKVGPYIPKPDNHLFLSLFSFLCCCSLLGLVALIYSVQVDRKYENGKKEESVFKSKNARCWALIGVMIGMLTILGGSLYAVIVFAILA